MEAKKIGAFIAAQRKELQMTQKQLGQELGISDKTVSKWECGNGLPDISIMLSLCSLLQINVNELLSGERLTQDTYHRKAEENMMNLMQDYENEKKGTVRQIVMGVVWIVSLIAVLFLPAGVFGGSLSRYLDLVSLLEIVLVTAISLGFSGRLKDFTNAFRYLFHEADNPQKLENAIAAVSLAKKSMLACGAYGSILGCLQIFFSTEMVTTMHELGLNLAVALITLLYSLLGVLILIPIQGRLEGK